MENYVPLVVSRFCTFSCFLMSACLLGQLPLSDTHMVPLQVGARVECGVRFGEGLVV